MMQRFFSWLSKKIKPAQKSPAPQLWQANLRPPPRLVMRKKDAVEQVEFTSEIRGGIEDGGPGKNVLVRNQYVREDTGTHETLKIISASTQEQGEDCGQDPYNSGRFDRSRSWGSRRVRK